MDARTALVKVKTADAVADAQTQNCLLLLCPASVPCVLLLLLLLF
jgi:hypothetical protein